MSLDDNQLEHAKVGSWFLGPHAENFDVLSQLFNKVLDGQRKARQELYPEDPKFITEGMQDLDIYKTSVKAFEDNVQALSNDLATTSVPFWSPRYNGHMCMDTAMASIIGCEQNPVILSLTLAEFGGANLPGPRYVSNDVQPEQCRNRGQPSDHHLREGGR
jgi:hypothetical protein